MNFQQKVFYLLINIDKSFVFDAKIEDNNAGGE